MPLGLTWLKGLTIKTGLANVIAHVDRVLEMISAGLLDPAPLVTHHMALDDARGGLCARMTAARRLKIVLMTVSHADGFILPGGTP